VKERRSRKRGRKGAGSAPSPGEGCRTHPAIFVQEGNGGLAEKLARGKRTTRGRRRTLVFSRLRGKKKNREERTLEKREFNCKWGMSRRRTELSKRAKGKRKK